MAIFTDGVLSTLDDLAAHDASILDVANTEGVDLTKKLELAQQEIGVELTAVLARLRGTSGQASTAPANYLESVVATPALKLWHVFTSLELAYRDAYHNQLNDRYKCRRDEYHKLAKWAEDKVMQIGIGLAADPVARATPPTVTAGTGALPAGMYYITMCWANARGEEGAAAATQGIAAAAGTGFRATPGPAPANAAGWNVYVGRTEETMRRQNTAPLQAGVQWAQTSAPTTTGALPGGGQEPSYLRPAPRVIQRG